MSELHLSTAIFLVGGAFSTAVCSYLYHALLHVSEESKSDITMLKKEIESLQRQITYLYSKTEALEEKQYESDILLRSHTELDKELKEYVHCNFDVI